MPTQRSHCGAPLDLVGAAVVSVKQQARRRAEGDHDPPPDVHQLLEPAALQLEGGDPAGDEGRADRDRHLPVELRDAVGEDLLRVGAVADLGLDRLGRDLQPGIGAVGGRSVVHARRKKPCAHFKRSYKLLPLRITPTAMPSMVSASRRRSTSIGAKSGFSASSSHRLAAAPIALHRHFVGEARDHDLPAARLLRAMHGEQIAFENSGVAHRHAAHAQQIVGARREQIGVDLVAALHMLLGEDRAARGDASDHRQLEQPAGGPRAGCRAPGCRAKRPRRSRARPFSPARADAARQR